MAEATYGFWDRTIRKVGGNLRHDVNRFVGRYSLIGDPPIFDKQVFDWHRELEDNWEVVLEEARQNLPEYLPSIVQLSPDHKGINQDQGWKSLFLWGYGERFDPICEHFPKTAALVDKIPGLLTAMFSMHIPGAHLKRHRGVTKGMITAHLPLIVPPDPENCKIEVEGEYHHWKPGELFVFDDTYYHETWNDTDQPRLILLMHVRRPLRGPGLWLQNFFFWAIRHTAFVKDARKNIEAWTDEFAKKAKSGVAAPTS